MSNSIPRVSRILSNHVIEQKYNHESKEKIVLGLLMRKAQVFYTNKYNSRFLLKHSIGGSVSHEISLNRNACTCPTSI